MVDLSDDERFLSVVVPVFGCKDSLEDLVSRILRVASSNSYDTEILLIDDCSVDGSWEVIRRICLENRYVRGIRLSRNFGQHIAIMAGFRASRGRVVVVMDCDLQDPPELIPTLVRGTEHCPVSIARRTGPHQSLIRRVQARFFHNVFAFSTGISLTRELTGFAALRRTVIDEYIKFTEPGQHFLHILSWLGFEEFVVTYHRPSRHSGKSSYTFKRRLRHAINGLLFETSRVLYIVAITGIFISFAGFVGALIVLFRALTGESLLGWPSTISAIVIFGGSSITIQSAVGVYVAKNFQQSKNRPLYVINELLN